MLDVLLESRAPRTRRVGGTVASALLHAGLIAGAVALTMPGPIDGKPVEVEPSTVWIAPSPPPVAPRRTTSSAPLPAAPTVPGPIRGITPPDVVPNGLPPIDLGPALSPDEVVVGRSGIGTGSPLGAGTPLGTGSVMDERSVDRAPRLTGRVIEPRYPASLREAGVQGRVVVQFVVDTLGRAELDGLQVMESAHPQFLESVRTALGRYRFTVGEAAGRKVRTRVQMPFEFALVR